LLGKSFSCIIRTCATPPDAHLFTDVNCFT